MICNLCNCVKSFLGWGRLERASRLVKGVGSGSPVCEEDAQTHGLEDAGQNANGDSVNGTVLNNESRDQLKKRSSQPSGTQM